MTFRIRTVETTTQGREIARNRDVTGDRVTIGRSADNTLHLPDLALDPHHATIVAGKDGRIMIEAAGSLDFTLDGRKVRDVVVDPQAGGELRIGSYRIAISRDDGAVLLTVGQVAEPTKALDEKTGFSLVGQLPGKRAMAWLLALVVLLGFLAVPIISQMTRDPNSKQGVVGDAAWSSGPLSLAHHQLEGKCEACHVKPFEAVRDTACLTCHKDVHDHAPPARLANARGAGSAFDQLQWRIAHLFGKPGPGACSDCHTEHEGAGAMAAPRQAFCADCHGSLKNRLHDTALGNASDFGKIHPEFRPALALSAGSDTLTRVSLALHPHEASGLTFPHDKHLDPRGGAAQMALRLGRGGGLSCKDCHHQMADGVRFLPVDMQRDCEACHSLAYDQVDGTFRKLRHGDVQQMIADLSVAPRSAAPIVTGRRRPGEYANGGTYFARFSSPGGGVGSVAQALSRDGVCGECHTPKLSGGRFSVVPVTQVSRYFGHGWFSHAAHKEEKCTSCHAVDRSNSATDLLLPDLKSCRSCHSGEDAPRAKVPSSCAMCHDYHLTAQAPRGVEPRRKR
jgi:hypothetical protein